MIWLLDRRWRTHVAEAAPPDSQPLAPVTLGRRPDHTALARCRAWKASQPGMTGSQNVMTR
jgi:hypothetical protein